ncbi:MAG TPA: hypothetical protein ENK55_05360 [Actinobacteria bacterium]|nr:hypothetical protein [Actinomycetota bacterium]
MSTHRHDLPRLPTRARTTRRAPSWTCALATVILVAACRPGSLRSTSSPTTSPPPPRPPTTTTADTSVGPTAKPDVAADDPVSPILDFLGGPWTGPNAQLAARERIVSDCMGARGWTYIPDFPGPDSEPTTIAALGAFRAEYGYGLSTRPPEPGSSRSLVAEQERYLSSLTNDELRAYREDLDGGVGEDAPPRPGSCRELAARATAAPIDDPALLQALATERAEVFADPRYLEAERAWASCMADRGYDFERPADAPEAVEARSLADSDPSVTAFELAVALADYECSIEHLFPIRLELEREVVRRLTERFPHYGPP